MNPLDFSFACLALFFNVLCSVAMAMVVETCANEVSWPFALLSGYCVGNCLRLLKIYCCHGDGSDGC